MLELLFRGFFEWIYGLILECWEYFSSVLFDLMSLDFAYLETYMPIITTIRQIMLGVGWALLLGNLVFQATRSMMAGVGFEADDPKLLFTRTFVFSFLLVASPQICDICLNMTSVIIDMVQMPDAAAIKLPDEGFFVDLTASWLLVIVFGLIVMFQTCKLLFEMAERYFILAVLTITAPLAFGVGGSRSTSDIFSGWCRMYGSMCLLMVMNVVFVKMLLSILSFHPSGIAVLPWIVMVLTKMYHYPFSNVYDDLRVCVGNNVLPHFKSQTQLSKFPRFLLGIPNNDDFFKESHNRLHMSHRELLEHLKDKEPAYYYTDVLVESGKKLSDFINGR